MSVFIIHRQRNTIKSVMKQRRKDTPKERIRDDSSSLVGCLHLGFVLPFSRISQPIKVIDLKATKSYNNNIFYPWPLKLYLLDLNGVSASAIASHGLTFLILND